MSATKTDVNLTREEWSACRTREIGGRFGGWTMVDRPGQGCWADKTYRNISGWGERAMGQLSPNPAYQNKLLARKSAGSVFDTTAQTQRFRPPGGHGERQ